MSITLAKGTKRTILIFYTATNIKNVEKRFYFFLIYRYRETALVMKNNISLFHAVFGHVDVATSIIECLNKYYAKLEPCFNIGLYSM